MPKTAQTVYFLLRHCSHDMKEISIQMNLNGEWSQKVV